MHVIQGPSEHEDVFRTEIGPKCAYTLGKAFGKTKNCHSINQILRSVRSILPSVHVYDGAVGAPRRRRYMQKKIKILFFFRVYPRVKIRDAGLFRPYFWLKIG